MSSVTAIQTQGSESRLLNWGIHAITTAPESYEDYPDEKSKIYKRYTSEKAYEIDVSLSGMGFANLKPEGTEISYDAEKQDFTTTYVHRVFAIGCIITFEAMMNNLYRDLADTTGRNLIKSLVNTDETLAADFINNGYTSSLLGDQKPLFAVDHVLGKGGTFANTFDDFTALSQAAVEDALIKIEGFVDGARLLVDAKALSLHIAKENRFVADRILGSTYEPGTANNAINPIASDTTLPGGYFINHRFVSPTIWFIKTDVDFGFTEFDRFGDDSSPRGFKFSKDNDFGTENYRHKGMLYKSYGATDPRCCWGNGDELTG